MDNEADQQLDGSRAMTRTRRRAGTRHTVASDDRLIEEIRAGRVPPDDPDPIAALLARWRLCGRPDSWQLLSDTAGQSPAGGSG